MLLLIRSKSLPDDDPAGPKHVTVKGKQIKVKFTLQQAKKVQRWSSGMDLLFLSPRR
jgi:hypothetical protein